MSKRLWRLMLAGALAATGCTGTGLGKKPDTRATAPRPGEGESVSAKPAGESRLPPPRLSLSADEIDEAKADDQAKLLLADWKGEMRDFDKGKRSASAQRKGD